MARVTVEVVKRELVASTWAMGLGGKYGAHTVPGGPRMDVTPFGTRGAFPPSSFPTQVDTLACGHTWIGNDWWHLRTPAPKRFCQECSDKKTKEIEQRKYDRLLKKAMEDKL